MAQIPELSELRDDDKLIVEFESVSCLAGPSEWVLEFRGLDSSSLRIRTMGRRVIPHEKTIQLDDEQKSQMNELFRALPSYVPGGTGHCNFRVSLQRGIDCISTWEFKAIIPKKEHLKNYFSLLTLCRTVQHHYRKPSLWEYISFALLMVGFGIVFVTGLLVYYVLWFPINHLRRLLTR